MEENKQTAPLTNPKPPRPKLMSLDREDLWVEALVPSESGLSPTDPISFQVSAISEIGGFGPKNSFIRLETGRELFFSLSYEDLRQRLRESEDDVLDLKAESRPVTRTMLKEIFAREAREKAEAEKAASQKRDTSETYNFGEMLDNMTFIVRARAPGQTDFNEITFSGRDVRPEVTEADSSFGGRSLVFLMRAGNTIGEFTAGSFIVNMTLKQFRQAVEDAYMRLQRNVDLRDITPPAPPRPTSRGPRPGQW